MVSALAHSAVEVLELIGFYAKRMTNVKDKYEGGESRRKKTYAATVRQGVPLAQELVSDPVAVTYRVSADDPPTVRINSRRAEKIFETEEDIGNGKASKTLPTRQLLATE